MLRSLIAELTRAAAAIERVLEQLRGRLGELEPRSTAIGRHPSAHQIAEEILDYLEENTSPDIELPPRDRISRPRLSGPAKTDSDRARAAVVAVNNADKAKRWDDFWRTWRRVILATTATAIVAAAVRIVEAAIRGHW